MTLASPAALARLAVLVLLCAVNYATYMAALRLVVDPTRQVMLLGLSPMIQILAVGYWVGRHSARSRRFLRGFLASGITSMLAFAVIASLLGERLILPLLGYLAMPLVERLRNGPYLIRGGFLVLHVVGSLLLVLPQLLVALLGGYWTFLLGETDERPNIPDRRPRSASPKP
jgi:hypothetical protein